MKRSSSLMSVHPEAQWRESRIEQSSCLISDFLFFIGSYISLFSSDSVFTKSRVYLIVPLVHYLNSQQTNEIWQ